MCLSTKGNLLQSTVNYVLVMLTYQVYYVNIILNECYMIVSLLSKFLFSNLIHLGNELLILLMLLLMYNWYRYCLSLSGIGQCCSLYVFSFSFSFSYVNFLFSFWRIPIPYVDFLSVQLHLFWWVMCIVLEILPWWEMHWWFVCWGFLLHRSQNCLWHHVCLQWFPIHIIVPY